MKLPNGYGSVTKLSGKRRRPYVVRKTVGWKYDDANGKVVQDVVIIGYAATKKEGLKMLADYNASPYDPARRSVSFAETYEAMLKYHFSKPPSESTLRAYDIAFRKMTDLHGRPMSSIRREDMQSILDSVSGGRSTKACIVTMLHQIYRFALMEDIVEKDYSRFLKYDQTYGERGEPLSQGAINALWEIRHDPAVQVILMLIYSGLRLSELKTVGIDIPNRTVTGGMKNAASIARVAPIHDGMVGYWATFDQSSYNPKVFREKSFYPIMEMIGFGSENGKKHTPHDCRHTFSWLADAYGIDETCKHIMMGHSLPGDIEQTVYRHRTLDQLRDAMNRIPLPPLTVG